MNKIFKQNEFRGLDSLDGLWTFVLEPSGSNGIGFANKWATLDLSTFKVLFSPPIHISHCLIDGKSFNSILAEFFKKIYYKIGWRIN